jgi:MFS family permease
MEEPGRLTVMTTSFTAGLGTPALRRLQASWGASALGSWAFFVTLAVYAYDAGGATAVGAAALVRMVPAGLAAPLVGLLVDRRPRRDVLLASLAARAGIVAAIGVAVATGASVSVVLVLAALFTIASTAHKPAQAALLPSLAETPRQLGAANALWTGVDNAAFLGGSLLGGVLIATTSVQAAFGATALIYLLSMLPMVAIPRDPVPEYRAATADLNPLAAAAAGVRDIAADRDVRGLVAFLTAATLVEGAVDVLVVVTAIKLLDLGDAGVGWLNAGWGLGGLLGGAATLCLLGRGMLSSGIALGGLLVGAALIAIAAALSPVVALLMLVALGVGYALIETAGISLLQRLTSDEVLGRAFAVVEATYWLATGIGAMLAPAVVALLGARGALLAVGACLPLLVAVRWRTLARFEREAVVPEQTFGLLRRVPAFAPLPPATVENLARRVSPRFVRDGEVVVRRGDPGADFYVVAEGDLVVSDCAGAPPPPLRTGDFFGEIALLRDIPRTATVTASGNGLLYVLDRDAFMLGVTAHPRTAEAVEELADARLQPR